MDREWYLRINSFAGGTPWLQEPLAAYALWGGLVLLSVLLVGGWWWARFRPDYPRRTAAAFLTGISTVSAVLCNQQVLSPAIGRIRPCHAVADAQALLPCGMDYSMPSDHCIIAGAFAAGLFFVGRKLGLAGTLAAVVLAFGRIYAGVHYPLDTVVGLAAGAALALVVIGIFRHPVSLGVVRLSTTPLARLVRASNPGAQQEAAGSRQESTP